jgi:hypothetical protein
VRSAGPWPHGGCSRTRPPGILGSQAGQDLARAVLAAVDDEQLGVGHQRENVLLHVADGTFDRPLLVERGQDHAQPQARL